MAKKVITLPTQIAGVPYSAGTQAGDFIFVSGQVGSRDDYGREIKDFKAQMRQVLENMKRILERAGASLHDVVKTTVFLLDRNDFEAMNEVYREYFPKDPPARSTVVVKGLAVADMRVEIEGIAYVGSI